MLKRPSNNTKNEMKNGNQFLIERGKALTPSGNHKLFSFYLGLQPLINEMENEA